MKTQQKTISIQKENGRFYTPNFIVKNILDMANYRGKSILKKHVMDNSCGDGAFLIEIAKRYFLEAKKANYSIDEIKNDLEIYIHGIEIESSQKDNAIEKLNSYFCTKQIININWDIACANALTINKYNGKMDFVLGNPPYIRVHHLGDSFNNIKSFSFAKGGMTDIYIVFYEIGIKMLAKNGILGYITPSSFFNSIAGAHMRKIFMLKNYLHKICDLKHFQAFKATTYTAIVILKNNKNNNEVEYYQFNEINKIPYFIETLTPKDFYIANNYYFAPKKQLNLLSNIHSNYNISNIKVKNGYATLCDSVFINDFKFSSKYIIPVIKASKGELKQAFFPYTKLGKLIDEKEIRADLDMYAYLKSNEEKLLKRSNENNNKKYWYAYGRSQAISDTFKNKLSINAIIRNENDLKFAKAPAGTGVYGGLYIISESIPILAIQKALKSKEFIDYIYLLGKYKSGGYYTFSSKDVKAYLDYKFAYGGLFTYLQTNNS